MYGEDWRFTAEWVVAVNFVPERWQRISCRVFYSGPGDDFQIKFRQCQTRACQFASSLIKGNDTLERLMNFFYREAESFQVRAQNRYDLCRY